METKINNNPAPLLPEQIPSWFGDKNPAEGDENGPFLVINQTGDVLDRRNYCGWKAPEFGDGYSDSRSDYDTSPEYLKQQEDNYQAMLESAPDHIKQALAEQQLQDKPTN